MALDLNRRQRRMANMIMRIGARRGIPQNRLGELAFAAYKESGLNPQAVNPSSGAAGLFQLLSSGYVNRANELGGVTNPRANILSILPSYKKYWQQNPQAAAGAAGRDVERSGLGAEWYAPTQQFRSALGSLPTHPNNQTLKPSEGIDPVRMDRSALMGEIMEMFQTTQETGQVDVSGVIGAYREMMDAARGQRLGEMSGEAGAPLTGGVPAPGGQPGPILNTPMPASSQFMVSDPEGAPGAGGRYHGAVDWFAPAGSDVRSPIAGTIVEIKPSQGNSGQIFGGVVKVMGKNGRVWVFRHVNPGKFRVGQQVARGQDLADITDWQSGSAHSHIELWKTLGGGYNISNMLDPIKALERMGL